MTAVISMPTSYMEEKMAPCSYDLAYFSVINSNSNKLLLRCAADVYHNSYSVVSPTLLFLLNVFR